MLLITDNGLGIPDNQKDKIFSMFRRFHTHVEGSGVGLYLVKKILENQGDRIEVESQVNTGSTFKVYFFQK
jgi:signal transduction histidine kinase